MLSDLRVLPLRLEKRACGRCGYACRSPLSADAAQVFGDAYELGAAPPTSTDRARQQRYAAWIADALQGTPAPASVFDAGCGNGALLLALREWWPAARLSGLEPSPKAARVARDAGLDVEIGTVEGTAPPATLPAGSADLVDLAITVNVLEHTVDPVVFLRRLAERVRPDGGIVIICPDGEVPGLELLFVDHLHSFTSSHLAALCREAGLRPRVNAHAGLTGFQMTIADRDAELAAQPAAEAPDLAQAKARYLERWRTLDARLSARLHTSREVICFGVGEAAGLLRAYAPVTWSRVTACTLDGSELSSTYAGLPVVPLAHACESHVSLLLAVNPADQTQVAARLAREREPDLHVVPWADLVDDDASQYSAAPPRRRSSSPSAPA